MSNHTPGPWEWFVDGSGRVYLGTPDRGRLIVMDFVRWGMQGAVPRFGTWPHDLDGAPRARLGGLMREYSPGMAPDSSDARLIAAAPELYEALRALLARVERERPWAPDHACAECVPDGEIVRPGFRCGLHAARAVLANGSKSWTRDTYVELATALGAISGKALLTINDHPEMRAVFKAFAFDRLQIRYMVGRKRDARAPRSELLYRTFSVAGVQRSC